MRSCNLPSSTEGLFLQGNSPIAVSALFLLYAARIMLVMTKSASMISEEGDEVRVKISKLRLSGARAVRTRDQEYFDSVPHQDKPSQGQLRQWIEDRWPFKVPGVGKFLVIDRVYTLDQFFKLKRMRFLQIEMGGEVVMSDVIMATICLISKDKCFGNLEQGIYVALDEEYGRIVPFTNGGKDECTDVEDLNRNMLTIIGLPSRTLGVDGFQLPNILRKGFLHLSRENVFSHGALYETKKKILVLHFLCITRFLRIHDWDLVQGHVSHDAQPSQCFIFSGVAFLSFGAVFFLLLVLILGSARHINYVSAQFTFIHFVYQKFGSVHEKVHMRSSWLRRKNSFLYDP